MLFMMWNKRFFLFFIGLFIFSFSHAQKVDLVQLKHKYPKRDIAYLSEDTELNFSLNEGKLAIDQRKSSSKILLNEQAKLYEEESINYSNLSSITEIEAFSKSLNGTKYKTHKVKKFNRLNSISEKVFYDDIKTIKFIYPEAKEGSICELAYKQEIADPLFIPLIFLGNYVPIENLTARIIVEDGIKIKISKYNIDDPINISKTKKANKTIYEIKLSNLIAIDKESSGPSFQALAPHIGINVVSIDSDRSGEELVLSSLDDLFGRYSGFIDSIDVATDSHFELTVDSIVLNRESELEKVEAIYNWVKRKIKYIAFEDNMEGFIPRDPQLVYDRRFGDCKDMSSLIVKMLDVAGIKGNFAWVGTRSLPYKYSESCGTYIDNHMIAMYFEPNEEKYYYLDATNEYLPFGIAPEFIQEKEVLVYKNSKEYDILQTGVSACNVNRNIEKFEIVIDDDVLKGAYSNQLYGYEHSNYQYTFSKYTREARDKRYQTYYAKGNNKSTISNILVDQDESHTETSFDIEIKEYISKTKDEIYINLNLDKVLFDYTISEHRKTDIDLERSINYIKEYSLEIPEGYKVDYYPDDFYYEGDGHAIAINYRLESNKIIYDYNLCVDQLWIKNEKFEEWSKFIKILKNNYKENVTLIKD